MTSLGQDELSCLFEVASAELSRLIHLCSGHYIVIPIACEVMHSYQIGRYAIIMGLEKNGVDSAKLFAQTHRNITLTILNLEWRGRTEKST